MHTTRFSLRSALLTSLLLALGLAGTRCVQADTYQVTNLNPSGSGSLRQAIVDANAHPGSDSIVFAPGVVGTISMQDILPDISESVEIQGPGANSLIIAMGFPPSYPWEVRDPIPLNEGIFTINSPTGNGPVVTISGLTLTRKIIGYFDSSPKGVNNVRGTVTMRNCAVRGMAGTLSNGAAIGNAGTMVLQGCTISNNVMFSNYSNGAGIYNTGTLTMANCTVARNYFDNEPGDQYPLPKGGGIYNSGTLKLSQCTLAGNDASKNTFGPGLSIDGQGGGIYNAGALTVESTIFWNGHSDLFNAGGTVVSQGYNMSRDGASGLLKGTGDRINIDPLLGSLQNNGGPTDTIVPLFNSPAINAGNPISSSLQTDQRGYLRVSGGRMDIGAVEYQAPLDFLGDGYNDLLFQNSQTGQIVAWSLNSRNVQGGAAFSATPQAGWNVVGSGDFNNDGSPDLVFQNATTGQIVIWYVQGARLIGGAALAQVPQAGYTVVGVGRFQRRWKARSGL